MQKFGMREENIKGRITISSFAYKKLKLPIEVTYWCLPITRLYSVASYIRNESDPNNDKVTYTIDEAIPMHPIKSSYFVNKNQPLMETLNDWMFYIAVKELTIEWPDYQTEVTGYIYCKACTDLIDSSPWYEHITEHPWPQPPRNETKELLRFVKSPGLRTTNIKINKEDLEFFPIKLNQCEILNKRFYSGDKIDDFLQMRREHQLECEIRPLFDHKKQILLIKNAHITVEIYLKKVKVT